MNELTKKNLKKIDYDEIYLSWRTISGINAFFDEDRSKKGDSQAMKNALETFIKGTKKAIEIIEKSGF